jgi:hypothetical protein
MKRSENRAGHPNYPKHMGAGGQQAEDIEIGRPSPERTRAANEVGSAIAHQLNGPLTALRLYIGAPRRKATCSKWWKLRFRKPNGSAP